jgi:tetratricopeptide (TPR) repeat protein
MIFWSTPSRNMKFLVSIVFAMVAFVSNANAGHTIAGIVFDSNRLPLPDIDVELLDQFYRVVANGRQKTGGGGRYEFNVATQGRYTVRVYAFRYDYEDQSQDIEVSAVTAVSGESGSSYNNLDFYLQPKKGGLLDAELSVVFAQDVPPAARRAYEGALRDFVGKRAPEGISALNTAIELMPNYFLALNRMGKELYMQGRYKEAVPFLLKAAEVNGKSTTALYYLGASLLYLDPEYAKAAQTSLARAAVLAPASPQVHFMLGRAQRRLKDFNEAEKSLLQAKKLTSNSIPEIHKELAQLYADDLKKYAEAADELEAFMKGSKQKGQEMAKTKQVIANLRMKAKAGASN